MSHEIGLEYVQNEVLFTLGSWRLWDVVYTIE